MHQSFKAAPARSPSRGRLYLWLSPAFVLIGIVIYVLQLTLHQLVVPWYAPVLALGGVGLALLALWLRFTWVRLGVLALVVLLCAFQWIFLLVLSRVPAYAGPVREKQHLAFTVQRPDREEVTEKDLIGQPTVLVLYRGRW